jgi:integrase
MKQFQDGLAPLIAKKRAEQAEIKTVDDLFADWHIGNVKRLKHHEIPERIYRKDIAPHIGSFNVDSVNARDIRAVLKAIAASGRPASAFSVSDAGGVEKSKDRALTIEELSQFFHTARDNKDSFSRDNYLACSLLVTLGIRKSELAEAPWKDFDLEKQVWNLSKECSKSGVGIAIPLPEVVMNWIQELKIRACGSEYVFPSRRTSKNPHMGADTLNRAITKLFGHEASKKKNPPTRWKACPTSPSMTYGAHAVLYWLRHV